MATGYVLDAGFFIALERGSSRAAAVIKSLLNSTIPLVTSAGVVAQVWRGGTARQVALAISLKKTEVVDLDYVTAKTIGMILGGSDTSDPVDAHIALLAKFRNWTVITSDPNDLRAIDPFLDIVVV